jgi:hypothetical protein
MAGGYRLNGESIPIARFRTAARSISIAFVGGNTIANTTRGIITANGNRPFFHSVDIFSRYTYVCRRFRIET